MRYFLHIGYDGSQYRGWQWQPNVVSVQGTIEEKLKRIFKEDITVYGCGRTDSGVHASQYILHINIKKPFDFDLKFRLNKNLPDDIVVYDIMEMKDSQHARYDATSRTYDYYIHLYNTPVLGNHSSFYEFENLDVEAMKKAAAILPLCNDFRAICRQPDLYKHTLCDVSDAKLYVDSSGSRLRFSITSDRFLRGMIRICVYFLLQIGNREMSFEEFEHILSNQLDVPVKRLALPNGLYLTRIEYPYLKVATQADMGSLLKAGLE
ncbi:tRNA pseudouridine(38-40) synthase TruA [bacterium]|nr:tRNA pseudouridine(38-40) synthase TruA [bacterium]